MKVSTFCHTYIYFFDSLNNLQKISIEFRLHQFNHHKTNFGTLHLISIKELETMDAVMVTSGTAQITYVKVRSTIID